MMGRTHSVHAEPITFGLKLASWAFELDRDRDAPASPPRRPAPRQDLGPGRHLLASSARTSRRRSLAELGLRRRPGQHPDRRSATGTRRSWPRSRSPAAPSSASRPRSATSSTPRSRELQEPFRAGQKGSSAMPHKRNPILSERLAGLARLLRGFALAGMEDQALWHERDISHSSVERVALPGATTLLHYMLVRFRGLVDGLVVRPERMRENIERGLGLHASSRLLTALVEDGGLSREDAYAIVQRDALRAADERRPFRELVDGRPGRRGGLLADQIAGSLLRRRAACCAHVPTIIARLDATGGPRRCRSLTLTCADVSSARARCATSIALDDDRLLLVASDRISAVRRRAADADPGQGPGADRPLALLVRARRRRRIVRQPPAGHGPGGAARRRSAAQADELRGRIDDLPPRDAAAGRAHRPRLPLGQWLEGLPAHRRRVRHPAAGRPARERPAAGADVHALDQGRGRATTRTSTSTTMVDARRRGRSPSGRATIALALYTFAARRARSGRASSWPTPSSSSASCPDRSGELLLIDEVLTPDSSRFWDAATYEPGRAQASFDKQFVRDWLETLGLGQDAARAGAARRGRRRHARPLRRGVRAHHRRHLRALPRGGRASASMSSVPLRRRRHAARRHPRPAGPGRRDSLPHLGVDEVHGCASAGASS